MYQFDILAGSQQAHGVNNAVIDTRTRMHRESGGFIEHQDIFVFINNGITKFGEQAFRGLQAFALFRVKMQRRNSHQVTDLQLVLGLAAFFVNAHLTLADDAVNAGARYVPERLEQKIVEPLIELARGDFDHADRGFLRLI